MRHSRFVTSLHASSCWSEVGFRFECPSDQVASLLEFLPWRAPAVLVSGYAEELAHDGRECSLASRPVAFAGSGVLSSLRAISRWECLFATMARHVPAWRECNCRFLGDWGSGVSAGDRKQVAPQRR